MDGSANGSHNELLKKTVPPAPTVRPENVPENARPALIRSVKRGNKEVWRWVWMWLIDGA
jgi:hypothetical protein